MSRSYRKVPRYSICGVKSGTQQHYKRLCHRALRKQHRAELRELSKSTNISSSYGDFLLTHSREKYDLWCSPIDGKIYDDSGCFADYNANRHRCEPVFVRCTRRIIQVVNWEPLITKKITVDTLGFVCYDYMYKKDHNRMWWQRFGK